MICGVTTNIESQEFRRRQNHEIGHAENPRASETDDLECLYGMCHSWLGPYFMLKEFKQKWPKIVRYVYCLTVETGFLLFPPQNSESDTAPKTVDVIIK